MGKAKKIARGVFVGLLAVFVAIQLVPYGRDKENPPVVEEPDWDSPRTRELAVLACFDCHSNETVWPWYSHIAPASWLVYKDVVEGREHLNLSEWHRDQVNADEAGEEIREGEMPLPVYLPLHPEADLSDEDKQALADGLDASLGEKEVWE